MCTKKAKIKKTSKQTLGNEQKTKGSIRKNNTASKDITFEDMQEALTGLYD